MKNNSETEWKYLSYLLGENTPAYGGGSAFRADPDKEMDKGDSCNTGKWALSNHIGTHVDCPRHFSAKGKTLEAYPADFWIFRHVLLIDMSPLPPGHIICWEDLSAAPFSDEVGLLLIRTGFSERRHESVYWENNPGFHPDVAEQLLAHFPNLRMLGFDSISLSPFGDRPLGRLAHQAFLDHPQPILILEDMDLSEVTGATRFRQVIVSPLRVSEADASPCTVFAEVKL